jgi:hypothetical protein
MKRGDEARPELVALVATIGTTTTLSHEAP